ncbi:MAG: amino acid adenylation domain-containing protein [Cyanobacteriota bacterium]
MKAEAERQQANIAPLRGVVVQLAKDDPTDPRLVAYWVPYPNQSLTNAELRQFLCERLPRRMVPSVLVCLDALPRNANGKIDRKALPPLPMLGDPSQRFAPSTALQSQLHSLWTEVLGHGEFGINDNFFAIGGHSLLAARLLSRIEKSHGRAISLAAVFQNPTIAELAAFLSAFPAEAQSSMAIQPACPLPGNWITGGQAYPASFAQTRLWLLHQLEPVLTAYHLPAVWRLTGDLDVAALEQALAGLIARHATLRTSFQLHGRDVVQLLHPPTPFALEAEALGGRDPEAVIEEWLDQERSTPFDLTDGLLLRGRLLVVSEREHVLLLNHHHIASDGWSIAVLGGDLTELYNARLGGRTAKLQPLSVTYQAFAQWQRQRLSGPRLEGLKAYWKDQLSGLEPLNLPVDQARPLRPSHRGGKLRFAIASDLLEPFEELCRSEGATLQMGLLTLVALLLQRISRQDDVAIGVPIWGRNHPDLEALVGLFVNTLPIRIRVEAGQSFRQLLAQVKATSLEAYDHQELPFEQMVEALNVERDTSRNPLVQVMLQLIDLPEPSLNNLDGVQVERMEDTAESSKMDLSIYLSLDKNQALHCCLVYATDLFSPDRIQRLSRQLLTLLRSVNHAPDLSIASLNLLPEAERLLIESWQQGPNIDVPDLCVHELFEHQVERTPQAIALICEEHQLTYQELNTRANQLAYHLMYRGVGVETIVAVCLERSVEAIVAILAIFKAGATYLPMDPTWPDRHSRIVLQTAHCRYLIADACLGRSWIEEGEMVLLEPSPGSCPSQAAGNPKPFPGASQRSAYVFFTSGTTAEPKGIEVSHHALTLKCLSICRAWQLTGSERILALSSFGFDISLREVIFPLSVGCTSILASESQRLSPTELARLVSSQSISRVQATPSHWQELVQHALHEINPARLIAIGEVLPSPLAMRLCEGQGNSLLHLYGTTEAPGSVGLLYTNSDIPSALAIGKPLHNTTVKVLDAQLNLCPIGVPGELHIGGEGLARGYHMNPALTAEKFIADPASADSSARLYNTGDLVSWNADGTLAFHGRSDQQIKLRGIRIEPDQIEASLLDHPAVAQAVVLLSSVDPLHPRLIAYWVAKEEVTSGGASQPTAQQLHSFLSERLPAFMVPSGLMALDSLPLTPNGKLDRQALPVPANAADGQRVSPSTDLEHQLHGIWTEVLGHGEFGTTDNFFAIGGHSLSAARMISRLEQIYGRLLSLATVFQKPTISGMQSLLLAVEADAQNRSLAEVIPADRCQPDGGPRDGGLLLASFSQARLWFLHQLQPDLTAYHLPTLWRVRGALDCAALEHALASLIERHATLRTSFELQGSEVMQLVHPPAPFHLAPQSLGDRDPEEVIASWLAQEESTPFDLSSGQLLRARLLAVAEQEHWLLINHHHIASDGWSLSILTRDLAELYNAHRVGRSPQLVPLRFTYHNYAVWQRQQLNGFLLQQLKHYWTHQLTGLEPLELPSDHPRPSMPSHQGKSVVSHLDADLITPFEAFCCSEGATLQMGVLTLVALLMHRTSRQNDLAIGVPIWGRNLPELEPLIGCFINTLPIRIRFQPAMSFRHLLALVKEASIGAYDHHELPFEQMVEALNLERDTSRNPLVQVMLQLIELPDVSLQTMDGLEVEQRSLPSISCRFDLEFFWHRTTGGGLSALIMYATDLFDHDRIERLAAQLTTLLASVVRQPDAPADALNRLPESERLLLQRWQQGPRMAVPDLGVHQLFEQQVDRTPDALSLIVHDQEFTYRELNQRANRLALQLIDLGVAAETIVAVCMERSVELIVALLAVLKAGGAYLPLDPAWPEERQQLLLREAGCPLLLNAQGPAVLKRASPTRPNVSGPPLAYVSYTSGSTGLPKGVAITHPSIVRLVDPANGFLLGAGRRVLQLAPVAFDAATFEIWGPLLNGGTLVVAPPGPLSLAELAHLLKQTNITTLWLTAGLFHAMVESELGALAGVRQVLAGGDVISPEAAQQLLDAFPPGHELINGYGPTENTTFTCCHRMSAGEAVDAAGVPIGRPIASTSVRVLEASGRPCPIGTPGELHIGGAGLARGYLNNSALTAETFVVDPHFDEPPERLYKTGDLVSWRADGTLAFHGRMDQQIKLRGFRIEPAEIEANLLAHPAVAQAAVVLRRDQPANPQLIAYWVARHPDGFAASPTTAESLRSFLLGRVPDFMVPAGFVLLKSLPLTSNGKLDRPSLPAPNALRPSLAQEASVAPTDVLEAQLIGAWEEVLGIRGLGVHAHFFKEGGHSLMAVRLISLIQQSLGHSLPLAALFHAPTVHQLAKLLRSREEAAAWYSLIPIQPHGHRPPLFGIHLLDFQDLSHRLGSDQPVYGLRYGMGDSEVGRVLALPSIEELASHYIDEMRRFQPEGPYFLMGHSFGGVVAYEMAQQLTAKGETLGLLALFDTYILAGERVRATPKGILANIGRMGGQELFRRARRKLSNLRISWNKGRQDVWNADPANYAPHVHTVEPIMELMGAYRPKPCTQRVVLFKPVIPSVLFKLIPPEVGWQKVGLVDLKVEDVPGGDHRTILIEPHVNVLAEKLRRAMDEGIERVGNTG